MLSSQREYQPTSMIWESYETIELSCIFYQRTKKKTQVRERKEAKEMNPHHRKYTVEQTLAERFLMPAASRQNFHWTSHKSNS